MKLIKIFRQAGPVFISVATVKTMYLTYAVIKNAYQAIVTEKPSINANPKLILHQCIIDNAYDAGIFCVNSSLQADNSLISNCGNNIILSYGGDLQFHPLHCGNLFN